MNEYANSLNETLTSLIREMSAAPAPYVKKYFTRKKKLLPFETFMQLLISMGATAYIRNSWNRRAILLVIGAGSADACMARKIIRSLRINPGFLPKILQRMHLTSTPLFIFKSHRICRTPLQCLHLPISIYISLRKR
ncbi:hypothetical protein GA0061096_3229 [Fictibacillus enclensis]|uniref:Uncharacterized protein n=1 Tax=Fictibacillus enclensis TaxID=1017270 RepID=A0A0V8J6L2_9BACL|nr:hypothetical protein AS030_15305 [Fictibacillus enclensis]SCC22657.1 hypothetical protein GA0061096_3229 [Fictibacillus enclensis]